MSDIFWGVNSVLGTILGGVGAFISFVAFVRIKKVDDALVEFKNGLLNKKKEKANLESFNKDKKAIYRKSKKLLHKVTSGSSVDEVSLISEINMLVAIVKRMIENYKPHFELAGISTADQEAFVEFMTLVETFNSTGEGDINGKMAECIKRLEIICMGKDVENEL